MTGGVGPYPPGFLRAIVGAYLDVPATGCEPERERLRELVTLIGWRLGLSVGNLTALETRARLRAKERAATKARKPMCAAARCYRAARRDGFPYCSKACERRGDCDHRDCIAAATPQTWTSL